MPTVQANGIEIYYETQGEGEPLVLIPYLAADQACYAFQVAEYAKHFTCFTVDLRGAGLSSKPEGTYTTELLAEDVAAFMQAAGVDRAHVAGLSLGAATGIWLAARHPERVKSLSLHSAWDATDPFLRVIVEQWRIMAQALDSVTEMVIRWGRLDGAAVRFSNSTDRWSTLSRTASCCSASIGFTSAVWAMLIFR